MFTISQLASYAGVTVRAVRHYHAKGLLPEPERDHCGYRRYEAASVVRLIKIRTLSDAGVPLARVSELLSADEEQFAAAIQEIDQRLRSEILVRQQHRRSVALLSAGDSLALPADVVAYLDRMRELGFRERVIEVERDCWILIAAAMPSEVPTLMAIKRTQVENQRLRQLYLDMQDAADCAPDDPRLPVIADNVAVFLDATATHAAGQQASGLSPGLITLLDAAFVEAIPCAPRLLRLLEQRGWTGWTAIRRTTAVVGARNS